MINYYRESSLNNSEIYKGFNDESSNGGGTTKKAINLIKTAKRLTNEDIEGAYILVRQITDTLTREAIRAFDDGRIVLLYNNVPALSVLKAVPFLTFSDKQSGKIITYVFMDNYITISRDGVMTMQAPILRDLLTGALIANGLKSNYNTLASDQYLQTVLMNCYTGFVIRILNREFSIAANKQLVDSIKYWINKFFLTQIFSTTDTPENIDIVSSKHFKYVDEMAYEELKKQYNDANPLKPSDLLALIKTSSPRMKSLSLMTFLSDWINYYYPPATLAVENIEYLIFMILSLLGGNNMISISASDIVKETKNIKGLRGELLKLI